MLKIYGRANSINVRKVLWAADEIGITFTREDWGRGYRPLTDPQFLALNPFGRVPVIDDDGFVLRESHAIVRYLAESRGRNDLYPREPRIRFPIDAWMDWVGAELYWGMRPVFFDRVVKEPVYDPATVALGAAELNRRMAELDTHLAGTEGYLMGHRFTLADIPAGLVVNRWMSIALDKPSLPHVAAYYDRLGERPAYRAHGRNGTP